jgi:hypothetical protein
MAFFRAGLAQIFLGHPGLRRPLHSYACQQICPTELSLPDMIATGARYGVGGLLLGELLFADRAGFRHRVSHTAYPFILPPLATGLRWRD